MYLVKPPLFLKWYYNRLTWNRSRKQKTLYLTFDDGPIPEITPFVLDTLKSFGVKATFFCVGENAHKNQALYRRISEEGHRVGNHTYNHLKGWRQDDNTYLQNIEKCRNIVRSDLFRPPYGRIKKSQAKELQNAYEIIMWDVLSGDFDLKISPEQCLENVIQYSRNGSIIVFHDNIKAIPRITYALPKAISYFLKKGYTFETL